MKTIRHLILALAASLAAILPAMAEYAIFDSATDSIALANGTTLGTTMTIEAVFAPTSTTDGFLYFEQLDAQEFKAIGANSTSVRGIGFVAGTITTSLAANTPVLPRVFHHLAYVRDGTEERIYLDGALVGSRPQATNPDIGDAANVSFPAAIGSGRHSGGGQTDPSFIGVLDSIRVSSTARYSGATITAPTGDMTSDGGTLLLMNFDLADVTGNVVTDVSGNGRNGTLGTTFPGATLPTISATSNLPAQVWIAGADLVANEHPDGPQELVNPNPAVPEWSYGERSTIASAAFTPYTAAQHGNDIGGFTDLDGFGSTLVNAGSASLILNFNGALSPLNPGVMSVHPGETQAPVVRWTAPTSGTYAVSASWVDIDPRTFNSSDGASGNVVVNGTSIFGTSFGNGGSTSMSQVIFLNVGDTVDFVVGKNNNIAHDTTAFNASIALLHTSNVIAHYRFENGPGTVGSMIDSSPNLLHGTTVGTLTHSTDRAANPETGAFSLDARADHDFGQINDTALLHQQGNLTVELFYKADIPYDNYGSPGGVSMMLAKVNSTTGSSFQAGFALEFNASTGFPGAVLSFSPSNGVGVAGTTDTRDGQWHHVALVLERNVSGVTDELRIYVDGVLQASQQGDWPSLFYGDQPLYIGAGNFNGSTGSFRRNFDGFIDEVRISAAALTPGEFLSNLAPTAITLSDDKVRENVDAGEVVGTLGGTDPNPGDTLTFSLVSGAGDTGNGSFAIVGNELRTIAELEYETQPAYSIRVRATDPAGAFFEDTFTITVLDAPVLVLPASPLIAGTTSPAGVVVNFTVSATDTEDEPDPIATAVPPSGGTFPVGDTTVEVSATDSDGVTTTGSFIVRVQLSPPGALAFVASTHSDRPANHLAQPKLVQVPITRASGSGGAVSVTVVPSQPATTPAGFAKYVYGTDYEFVTGSAAGTTVNFADGQTSATVDVQLKTPVLTKKGQFKLTLSGPAGGATLGTITVCTVTINARDTTKPTITIAPALPSTLPATFTVAGTVKEAGGGLHSFKVFLNGVEQPLTGNPVGSPSLPTGATFSAANLAAENGSNHISIEAIDLSGNRGFASKTTTYLNNRPQLTGTYNAVLEATGTPDFDTTGLVTVVVTSTGSFTGKVFLSDVSVPFKGTIANDGGSRFVTIGDNRTSDLLSIVGNDAEEHESYLGAITFTIDETNGMIGTLQTARTGGSVLASFEGKNAPYTSLNPVPPALVGKYTAVFPSKEQTLPIDHATYPQGDGIAFLSVTSTGGVSFATTLADGSKTSVATKLRADLTVPFFRQLYRKRGAIAGDIAFADLPDSDLSGTDLVWLRPELRRARYYQPGWPDGIRVDAVGTKYTNPASLDFGQGAIIPVNGNASLVFTDGSLTSTQIHPVNVNPATGSVGVLSVAYSLSINSSSGGMSGYFLHSPDSYRSFFGALLNKGANKGGFGFFLDTPPLVFGATGQSGGVSLEP